MISHRNRTALLLSLVAVCGSAPLFSQNQSQTSISHIPGKIATVVHNAVRTPYFVDPKAINLSILIPSPPAESSEATKSELNLLHQIAQSRTPAQVAAAQADAKEQDIFLFKDVLGGHFTADGLPLTAALSAHVRNDSGIFNNVLKGIYERPRPYNYDPTLHSVCGTDQEFSYPSGHAMVGYLLALTLIEMVPEKHDQILARADGYTHNRLVCGVHHPSDIEGSRRAAYALFGYLLQNPKFQSELASARAELRGHLGMP